MRFEARDLKAYAEPVRRAELETGHVYFAVQFVDDEMLVPGVEPLVYLGPNLIPDDRGLLYFQDAQSYGAGVRIDGPDSSEAVVYAQDASEVNHIFTYENALDVLLRCSRRRTG
jgi:hypothetical protein